MAYTTLSDALDAIKSITTTGDSLKSALLDVARQASIDATGAVTVFYSGGVGNVSSSDIVTGLLESNADIRVIDKSVAGQLLSSDIFRSKVAEAFGTTLADLKAGGITPEGQAALNWLFNPPGSPWSEASGRFASATVGEARFIGPAANITKNFGSIELRNAIASGMTSLEGIPIDQLKDLAKNGNEAVFKAVVTASEGNIALSGFKGISINGNIVLSGTSEFLNEVTDTQKYLIARPEAYGRWDEYIKAKDPAAQAALKSSLNGLMEEGKTMSLATGGKVLNKLGYFATALSFGLAASQAAQAFA